MSSTERVFTRRQLAVIAKIAFIEAMALSLIIPTISSTGEVTTTPVLSHVEKSFFTCTVPINGNSCSVSKTFNTAFTSKPTILENWNGSPPAALFLKAFTQAPEQFVFQGVTSTTWLGMPTALTELYGSSNLWIAWGTTSITFTQENWKFCINLVTGSSGATPILFTQFSTDGGVTWTTMGDAAFAVSLVTTGFICGTTESIVLPQTAILRVAGSGGNNAGDNPVFGLIELDLTSALFNISVPTPCAPTFSLLTTASVTLTIKCNNSVLSAVSGTVDWKAELS